MRTASTHLASPMALLSALLLLACEPPEQTGEEGPIMPWEQEGQPTEEPEQIAEPTEQTETDASSTRESSFLRFDDGVGSHGPQRIVPVSYSLSLVRDARAALERGEDQLAVDLLEQSVQTDPQLKAGWDTLLEYYTEAEELADAAETCAGLVENVVLQPSERPRYHLRCALLFRSAGDLERAEQFSRNAVESSGYRIEAMNTLAAILLEQGRFQAVVDLLDSRIRFPGSHLEASAFNNLGAAYASLGRYERAEEAYRQGLELNSRDTGILLNLSDVLRLTERMDERREVLEQILTIDPDHQEAQRRLNP